MQWFIVGLGNPGKSYEDHRHSVGFQVLYTIQKMFDFTDFKLKNTYLLATGSMGEEKISLICPQKFMNLSGEAIASLASFHKKDSWLVIHDELDLVCGDIRFKRNGGTGGHNGLKSMHRILGENYLRLRIGIDRPANKEDVSRYVLSSFTPEQKTKIAQGMTRIIDALPLLIAGKENDFTLNLAKK